jgi:hypothetical protein
MANQAPHQAICANVQVTDSNNLYGGYNCRAVEGEILDVSSYGNDAALTGQVPEPHLLGPAVRGCGNDSIDTGIDATQLNPRTESHTVCGWALPCAVPAVTAPIFCKGVGGANWSQTGNGGVAIIHNGTIKYAHFNGAAYVSITTTTSMLCKMVHIGYTIDHASTLVTLYIDGVAAGTLADTTLFYLAAVDADGFRFLGENSISATIENAAASIIAPQIYKEVKSADWFAAEYAKAATALWHTTPGVELVTNTTTGQLSNSLFEVISGTHKITESDGTKSINCVGTGVLAARTISMHHSATEAAYGTWEFSTTGAASTMIIATVAGAYNAAAQNGFQVEINSSGALKLQRITSGAVASTLMTTANATISLAARARIVVTRSNTGVFTVYADGVKLTAASGSNPATDATHTTSDYLCLVPATNTLYTYCDKCGGNAITKRLIVVPPE